MKKLLIIFMTLLAFGCGRRHTSQPNSTNPSILAELSNKYDTYAELIKTHQDQNGFIETANCDALLFSSLIGAAGIPVDIDAARGSDGKWYRRPLSYVSCYPKGSPSSISKDMILGLMIDMWKNKRLDLANALYDYAIDHNFIMGDGPISRTGMSPSQLATLCDLIYHLGGHNHQVERNIPQIYVTTNTGFESHLDILSINLRGDINGSISSDEISVINAQASREPTNSLFQYVKHKYSDGNYAAAAVSLLNEHYFPSDRLPTSADREADWMWQRDSSSWAPGAPGTEWDGGDFIAVAGLILDK